jgi:4-hydroxybenzoyl-CoA thioesterase
MRPMSQVHVFRLRVKFGDCDPAGIVYYPKFFDWFHQAMESWFDEVLGAPYAGVIRDRKIGFPAAHTQADFKAPCAIGEDLAVEVRVGQVGRSAVHLDFRVRPADDPDAAANAIGSTVVVTVGLDPTTSLHLRPIALPEDLRTRIQAFADGADG